MSEFERAANAVAGYLKSRTRRGRGGESGVPAGPLTGLLVTICASGSGANFKTYLANGLESLLGDATRPSVQLVAALAWAKLGGPAADLEGARALTRQLLERGGAASQIPSWTEISTSRQLRETFAQLRGARGVRDVMEYVQALVDHRVQEWEASVAAGDTQAVIRHVGIELAARLCLVEGHRECAEIEEAIQHLQEAEELIVEHQDTIPPGFLALDWLELARAGRLLGLQWAASRYCARGLEVDPDREELRTFQSSLTELGTDLDSEHLAFASDLAGTVSAAAAAEEAGREIIARTRAYSATSRTASEQAVLMRILEGLGSTLTRSVVASDEVDELVERASSFAAVLMSEGTARKMQEMLSLIARRWGTEGRQVPVELRLHEDVVWPRSDDQEGCCLVFLESTVDYEVPGLTLEDAASGHVIWKGVLKPGATAVVRWLAVREDGFVSGEDLELRLNARWRTERGDMVASVTLPARVAEREPQWPNYRAGALTPDDVEQLYGRADILEKIRRSLVLRFRNDDQVMLLPLEG